MDSRFFAGLIGLCVALCGWCGCAALDRARLSNTSWKADRLCARGQYSVAALLCRQKLADSGLPPATRKSQRLWLRYADCFYNEQRQATDEIRRVCDEYLRLYPAGHYRTEALRRRERAAIVDAHYGAPRAAPETASGAEPEQLSAEQLQALLAARPYDDRLHQRLGDAWRRQGRADAAFEAYRRRQEIEAALLEYELLSTRRTLSATGDVRSSHTEQQSPDRSRSGRRRGAAAAVADVIEPLLIFGVREIRIDPPPAADAATATMWESGSARTTRSAGDWLVLGNVRNQHSRRCDRVVVRVTFYDSGDRPLETVKTVLHDLPPGAVRVFDARIAAGTAPASGDRVEIRVHEK